jgi:hypothetical protein
MNIFCVLSDGETFSGHSGSVIAIYADDSKLTDDEMELLQNGELPDKPLAVVDLEALLAQALIAKLPCVKKLRLLGMKG